MASSLARVSVAVLGLISTGVLAAPSHKHAHEKRDLVIPNPPATGWKSLGCYTEANGARALTSDGYNSGAMTIGSCIAYCNGKGYYYAGVEYAGECYCGDSLSTGSVPAPATDCNMACSGDATEPCGAGGRLNMFSKTSAPPAPPSANPGPPGWGYQGCYTEGTTGRLLTTGVGVTGGLTVAKCTAACALQNFQYAGVEYAGECFCGNALSNGGVLSTNGGCTMLCNGNSSEFCGGGDRLNVYKKGVTAVSSSSVASSSTPASSSSAASSPAASGWNYLGCYAEGTTGRALPNGAAVPGGAEAMTVDACQTACKAAGYKLAGVEYAQECWCGNTIVNGGGPAPDGETGCSAPCKGNPAQMCGGGNRLNVYSFGTPASSSAVASSTVSSSAAASSSAGPSGWTSLGCYTDPGPRTLLNYVAVQGGLTIEKCQTACSAAGYTLAGVEYAGECWCDTQIRNQGVPAASGCNMPCNGDATQTCGGPNRLNVYQKGASTASSTVASSTVASSSSSSSAPASTSMAAGWQYSGCYVDNNPAGRILANQQGDSATLTNENCINLCKGLGYTVAGMEFSSQCFCDNVIRYGAPKVADTDCAMACSGNGNQKCGGPNRMSIYYTGTLTLHEEPKPQTGGLEDWKYIGCVQDLIQPGVHLLPNQLILQNTNSPANCLKQCKKFGHAAGAMEYGMECYCGDPIPNPVLRPEGECNDVCPGNETAICGAGARMTYYVWNGEPLATFGHPTGAQAGRYEFLIGGVVVPLMTTVGINGKIMFMEKFGTGAVNSTGAYEFDPAFDNDFSKAWREVGGLKTDIFCSAGLVLPDKTGRQITIGGWSDESTSGVRLYTPDGSPGTPSVNKWQENVQEVKLQIGRWYPTAMILANGSILVVGGEKGSNDAPRPNLEILPTVGPILDMPWLAATDPYNLYPFLAVLPTGGVVAAYYNEARILDENTFATLRVLPPIPAGVTSAVGGRTYPLEGTMMLLPQKYPYTEKLRMLICGGSTPFTGVAIDNCVSIAPEDPTDDWLIERMPSKRVMSCMTALPDGTYLIVNGGQQGVAGFGLADDPNLNAVLYDPSKPAHKRMSVMANTTIARMYHSEAILMPDGRVLVTGSDPQSPVFPEEYRVEVFLPPYLTSNAPRPSFQLNNGNDFGYGQQITIGITALPSGNAGNIKISLLGAESSTHGATMGQRTIFPQIQCTTTACTITTPPNAHVSPPGWFQLFLLDNGIPSHSKFVRIGGDPGQLGNWPPFNDFTKPGI